jgi:hypothetical protein
MALLILKFMLQMQMATNTFLKLNLNDVATNIVRLFFQKHTLTFRRYKAQVALDIPQYCLVLIGCRTRQEDLILNSNKYVTVPVTCYTFGTVRALYLNMSS